MNVLLGAIYGTWTSTFLSCFLTAVGSTCAYQLSKLSRPLIKKMIPRVLTIVESHVERFRSNTNSLPSSVKSYDDEELWSYLLVARLLPIVPYSGLNMASGVLEIPLSPFFWTLVLGSLPYNFITTQVGEVLSETTRGYLEHRNQSGSLNTEDDLQDDDSDDADDGAYAFQESDQEARCQADRNF
ncbi:snare associated Golgi protein-domain-containing protein [Phakopsora pachyrhizi]|nr:snare associated Golgi protein-domain-containing protein [Phakopsora pachyrhizi]